MFKVSLLSKYIDFLIIIMFFSIFSTSKANYNPVETLQKIDNYTYENRYGSSVLDEAKKEHYWQKIFHASGDRSQELAVVYSLMKEVIEKEKSASTKKKVAIKNWVERMKKILAYNKVSVPN
ncbi:hypothetical protein [Providencia heimbachae]|uniref:Uncharacterized protein n=1 Tax=Providencia heimbachae ATCC 35613 TaxID=1354272 RepID=A0A1B7JZM4_9GAMM|nr:hypothetical protein [Providencia heimbachae]OAT53367.1 hypothetical protein M998_1055 [Providencia heimbachae ATCC 35613]SQH14104.1 Uncharacterised protein [Providencia heimbachae]